ncbi:MAG: HTTM domain protein [Candidatus Peregrinibacteria bacterium Greene0416_62]|nr:MAG: HTTM domain protein [Candidatus Peregrinibacteria bacterium Greene0416_62]TSC99788.1 MAG: HTTM domain protein [Candidatus Peregrinibacteria bacterium Greene1014_49]
MTKNLSKAWHRFFLEPIAPHSLAVMRIALGGTLIALWLRYLPHVDVFFSNQGLALPYWEPQAGSLSILLTHPAFGIALMLYGLLLIASIGILLGWHFRFCSALAALMLVYFGLLSFHNFLASWGRLLFFTLMILGMSGADKTYSLRMRRKKESWSAWEAVPAWPQRIIAIQITMTYLGVGLQKAYLPDWQSGEILAFAFVNGWSTPLAHSIAQWNLPMVFYDSAVITVKVLHGLLPIGLWIPRYQRWCFLAGAMFHIGVTLIMGMWWFLLLIPLYAAFVDLKRPNSCA